MTLPRLLIRWYVLCSFVSFSLQWQESKNGNQVNAFSNAANFLQVDELVPSIFFFPSLSLPFIFFPLLVFFYFVFYTYCIIVLLDKRWHCTTPIERSLNFCFTFFQQTETTHRLLLDTSPHCTTLHFCHGKKQNETNFTAPQDHYGWIRWCRKIRSDASVHVWRLCRRIRSYQGRL